MFHARVTKSSPVPYASHSVPHPSRTVPHALRTTYLPVHSSPPVSERTSALGRFLRLLESVGGVFVLVLVAGMALAPEAAARSNAVHRALLDSPVKVEPVYAAGEAVACSLALPGSAALFGLDEITGTSPREFLVSELFDPHRVWRIDESCNIVSSWAQPSLAGVTATGIAVSNSASTYWITDSAGLLVREMSLPGGTPTGATSPLPAVLAGPCVIDNHASGEQLTFKDLATGWFTTFDLPNRNVICSYGPPAAATFGNGLGDAADPSLCGGATLVSSSGTIQVGGVDRVSQMDCNRYCDRTWDLLAPALPGFTFINGIDEYASVAGGGERRLALVENAASMVFMLRMAPGITECQGMDASSAVLYIDGTQGGPSRMIEHAVSAPIATTMQLPPLSPGAFVFQMHAGAPSASTLVPLLDLGSACFDFLGGGASIVENNLGRRNRLGATSYFGVPRPDPAPAPTFVQPTSVTFDAANLPSGSDWTAQAIVLDPAASSTRGAALTNGILLRIR